MKHVFEKVEAAVTFLFFGLSFLLRLFLSIQDSSSGLNIARM